LNKNLYSRVEMIV